MKSLHRYWIQIMVAILTATWILSYPVFKGGSAESMSSFRTAFGSLAALCFGIYVALFALFSYGVRKKGLSGNYLYIAHAVAFLLGYYLLYATFVSISNGGLPSIV